MSKEYRIDIFFVGGTTYSTTLTEQQKDRIIKALNEKRIERMTFGPDIKNNEIYIINIKNINLIKISEIKEMRGIRMDIEEDIKILEKFKNNEMQRDKLERDSRCGGWKIGDIYKKLELNIAIEHILAEREEDKKAIDKLKEENYIYMLNGNVVELEMYIKNNYIPKQKVVDKMEQLNKEIKNGDEIEAIFKIKQQQILQELLEDK